MYASAATLFARGLDLRSFAVRQLTAAGCPHAEVGHSLMKHELLGRYDPHVYLTICPFCERQVTVWESMV